MRATRAITTEIDPQHLDHAVRGEEYQPGCPFPQGATWDGKGLTSLFFFISVRISGALPVRIARPKSRRTKASNYSNAPTGFGTWAWALAAIARQEARIES